MHKLRVFRSPAVLVAILALVIAIASCSVQLSGNDDSSGGTATVAVELPQEFARLSEVWAAITQGHLDRDSIDAETISAGAIRGMLQALDDPYASYLTPEQHFLDSQDFSGHFSGIGAQVAMRDGRLIIMAPLPDTPAEAAGLRPGDVILSIDGESTDGIGLREAVLKVRGLKGTPVELLILHERGGEPAPVTIIRDDIESSSVKLRSLVGGIGHLQITSLTETTEKDLIEAIETFRRRNNRGLILDLRDNPGGLLGATVNVASQFLEDGLVLYEIDADGKRTDWRVRSGGVARDIPMVVLMNEFSASGAEVLAGALIDHQRATTIGVKTFGKGSVTTLRQLSDGSGLYFTTAHWFTPNGTLIEGEGLEPDLVVERPDDGASDPQLNKALELIREMIEKAL